MSDRSSVYAAVLALSVAFAGFSVLSVWAPVGYPLDMVWDDELIREVVFDGGDFRALEIVQARLVYRNPSDRAVSFNLTYPVSYTRYVDGVRDSHGGSGAEGDWEMVTVPAGGEYTVCHAGFQPEASGWYEVEWDGMWRGVYVGRGDLIPRIVTDKRVYDQYENGYATLEYYNPHSYPVSFGPPLHVELGFETDGVREDIVMVRFISWISSSFQVPPGGVFRVGTFYFKTEKAGYLTLTGMGVRETVIVLPVER